MNIIDVCHYNFKGGFKLMNKTTKDKKEKMITILVTKPFFDRMKTVVDHDDELSNMSELVRIGTTKEMNRREDK